MKRFLWLFSSRFYSILMLLYLCISSNDPKGSTCAAWTLYHRVAKSVFFMDIVEIQHPLFIIILCFFVYYNFDKMSVEIKNYLLPCFIKTKNFTFKGDHICIHFYISTMLYLQCKPFELLQDTILHRRWLQPIGHLQWVDDICSCFSEVAHILFTNIFVLHHLIKLDSLLLFLVMIVF